MKSMIRVLVPLSSCKPHVHMPTCLYTFTFLYVLLTKYKSLENMMLELSNEVPVQKNDNCYVLRNGTTCLVCLLLLLINQLENYMIHAPTWCSYMLPDKSFLYMYRVVEVLIDLDAMCYNRLLLSCAQVHVSHYEVVAIWLPLCNCIKDYEF